jgi:GNAT superfamily N-acetyltransferase
LVKVVWDLSRPLPRRRVNEKVTVKPVGREQLIDIGKILVVTWKGFIENPESSERYLKPHIEARIEQPFIAYLGTKPVGCVTPKLDNLSKVGVLDGGVHVLPEYRRQHVGTTLLLTALRWLKEHGMESVKVTPWNPEGEEAIKRAIAFYVSTGGEQADDKS